MGVLSNHIIQVGIPIFWDENDLFLEGVCRLGWGGGGQNMPQVNGG